MKRRILLVDDEVAVLLTLKAVLEINGFEVETSASAREATVKIRKGPYNMVISDMRMESDDAGLAVVQAARKALYEPAVAMLTAFPMDEADWGGGDSADQVLVKPMHTRELLLQIEALLESHENKKRKARKSESPKHESSRSEGAVAVAPAAAKSLVKKKRAARTA